MRTTSKIVNARVEWIANELKTPKEYFNKKTKKVNIGHLSFYSCLGSAALHQTVNDAGGVRVLAQARTKGELFDLLGAFYDGLTFRKRYK